MRAQADRYKTPSASLNLGKQLLTEEDCRPHMPHSVRVSARGSAAW